ncbi:MAG: peptidoglycan-binding protein [Saccharothrix sp.]|nr:peptidoglycan-binding protein [Saccharothrix sp.]
MSLTKLHFEVFGRGCAEKATDNFFVDFNPAEYTLGKWNRVKGGTVVGKDSPVQQWVSGGNEDLSLTLLFDAIRNGYDKKFYDVPKRLARLHKLMEMSPDTHAVPKFQVTWGTGLSLLAVAVRLRQRFTLFDPTGIPLRAEVTLTIRQCGRGETQGKETKKQSPDRTKAWVVRRGETMTTIAAHAYDDPRHWRVIADHNPAADPRRPAPGTVLELPPLPSAEGAAR